MTEFEEDYLKKTDSDEDQLLKLEILQSRFFLIKKVGKTTDLNMLWLNNVFE